MSLGISRSAIPLASLSVWLVVSLASVTGLAQFGLPKVPSKPKILGGSAKLHPDVQRGLTSAVRALDQSDKYVQEAQDASNSQEKEAIVKKLRFQLDKASADLKEAEEAAVAKGQSGHPELLQARARLSDLEKKYEAVKDDTAQTVAGEKAAVAGAAAMAKEMKKDYDRLNEQVFSKAPGSPIYYNTPEEPLDLIVRIEAFEKDELPGLKERLAQFERELGTDKDAIDAKAEADGYDDPYYRASWAWEKMREGIQQVARTRTVMAEDLLGWADRTKDQVKTFTSDFSRVERYEAVKTWLELAVRFDATNARARKDLDGFKAWRDADWKEFSKAIDARVFPGPRQGAPGNAAALAKAGQSWFEESLEWGRSHESPTRKDKDPQHIVTVVVMGPWSVQATNIAGQPTMYGVPAKVVVSLDREKDFEVVRVYEVTLRTAEHVGVKQAPPFDSVTVGSSYYVRPSAVKAGK